MGRSNSSVVGCGGVSEEGDDMLKTLPMCELAVIPRYDNLCGLKFRPKSLAFPLPPR